MLQRKLIIFFSNQIHWDMPMNLFEEIGRNKIEGKDADPFSNEYERVNISINNQFDEFESHDFNYNSFYENLKNHSIDEKEKHDSKQPIDKNQIITISHPVEKVHKINTEKHIKTSEEFNIRRVSTHLEECLSELNAKQNDESNYKFDITSKNSIKSEDKNKTKISKDLKNFKNEEVSKDEEGRQDDPDFYYKSPRKHNFEYNRRKDVILKTILRKCRRELQNGFNDATKYFQNRKTQGPQFLKECLQKYYNTLSQKPEQLDLFFYLGSILYPQEMSRGVDCFIDCDKTERVKQRKIIRLKIQKVYDVLYRYSHEKNGLFC